MKNLLILVIVAASIQIVESLYCKKTSTDIWGYTTTSYISCSTGYKCCGSYSSRYCCYDYDYSYSYTSTYSYGIGAIIGGVVGGIVFIIVVITIIVCVCKSNNRSRGVVVQAPPPNQPNLFVVNQHPNQPTNSTYPPTYPGAYPPAYPPAYPGVNQPEYPPTNPSSSAKEN